jgi:RecB family exonuclease
MALEWQGLEMTYTVKRVSPSQITTFRRCKARWWWQYPQGIKPPPHPSAELGTAVHKILEEYRRDGTPIDMGTREGQIAAVALPYIQARDPWVQVEQRFQIQSGIPGVILIGRIDETMTYADGSEGIRDWKTTSDFAHCKTEDELRADPQSIIYCAAREGKHAGRVTPFQHFYLRTKAPYKERLVSVDMGREEISAGLEGIRATIREMQATATAAEPNGLESTDACNDYGGCPHRQRCASKGIKSMGLVTGLFTRGANTMGSIDNFFASLGGTAPAAPQPAAPAAPQPAAPAQLVNPPDGVAQTEPLTLAEVETMASKPKKAKGATLPDGRPLQSVKADEMRTLHAHYWQNTRLAGVLDAYTAASSWDGKSQKRTDLKADLELMLSLLGGVEAPAAAPAAPEPQPAQTQPAPAAPEPVTRTATEPVQITTAPVGLTLYIDCVPSAGGAMHIHDWPVYQQTCEQAAAAKGVGYFAALPYLEGERMVADGIAKMVAAGAVALPNELVILPRGGANMAHLLEALKRHASAVIQGVIG